MQDVADKGQASDERIRKAAEDTLREWPDATAVVLFGSRARGDYRPDSDWDIAIMTRTEEDVPEGMALQRLGGDYKIQLTAIPDDWMNRKCNAPGDVAFNIARQGRVLSGRWKAPPLEENPRMQPEEFMSWYGQVELYLRLAAIHLVMLGRDGASGYAENFVSFSWRAAERLFKGMICRHRGILPDKSHDVGSLIQMLPESLRQRAGELDGLIAGRDLADCAGSATKDFDIAGRQVVLAVELFVEELADSKKDASTVRVAEKVAREFLSTVENWAPPMSYSVEYGATLAIKRRGDERAAAALEQREPIAEALEAVRFKLERILRRRDPAPTPDATES